MADLETLPSSENSPRTRTRVVFVRTPHTFFRHFTNLCRNFSLSSHVLDAVSSLGHSEVEHMKTSALLLAVLAFASVSGGAGIAQNTPPDDTKHPASVNSVKPELLEKNFLWALNFNVDGVVEDALKEVAKMKLDFPSFESRAIRKKVDDLAEHGNSPTIRYRASLTKIVFESPELFKGENLQCCREGEEFFAGIVRCLEKTRLTD
jgi:hypothetical protein